MKTYKLKISRKSIINNKRITKEILCKQWILKKICENKLFM